jgi:hypothetical protein
MISLSPELRKALLFILFLIPWFSLYQKHFFPHLAQTGFNGQVITITETIFIIFIAIFGKHPKFNKNGYILLGLISLWHGLGFLSAYLGEHFYPSAMKQIDYVIHCLFAYSVWVYLSQTNKQEKMAWYLVATLIWLIYYIVATYHSTTNAYDINWTHYTPFFNNIRHFGFLQIAIIPFIFLPLFLRKQYGFLITLILLTVYWGSVIWTASRGTFIASIIVSIIAIIYFEEFRKNLIRLTVLSILLGSIIALQFPSDSTSLNPFRLLFLNINTIKTDATLQTISSGRIDMWLTTLKHMWEINPYLGFAADGYRYVNPHILINSTQPHSGPVQLISEFGLLGFLTLLSIVICIINLYTGRPASVVNLSSRLSILGIMIASCVDGHFYYNFSLLFIALITALSFAPSNSKDAEKKVSRFVIPVSILVTVFILLIPISKHWSTYIEQQFILLSEDQLSNVFAFPSYYHPLQWIYSSDSTPELRTKAIKFGQKYGANRCNYYLVEYFDNNEEFTDNELLLESIDITCADYALLKTENEELIRLIKGHK